MTKRHIFFIISTITCLVFFNQAAQAADPQKCTTGQTCQIGEFLYDDDYNPITTATCTITSRDPSSNLYINSASMTHTSGGYYTYSSIPTDLGIYPTQICCNTADGDMCLDKTFEVVDVVSGGSSLTAADVWDYSNRSLTSFGSLTEDIWGYSARSLTSFGDLVSDIWNRSDRTLTQSVSVNTTNLATKSDFEEIKKLNQENRLLLEKIVNKPIIENFIDEGDSFDLNKKLTDTENALNSLFSTSQTLKNKLSILSQNWSKLSKDQSLAEIAKIKKIVNEPDNNSTITSHINWLRTSWGSNIYLNLTEKVNSITNQLEIIQNQIPATSPTALSSTLQKLNLDVIGLDNLIGHSFNYPGEDTAFGNYLMLKEKITVFDKTQKDLLGNIGQPENLTFFENSKQKILELNNIPEPEKILNSYKKSTYNNKIYSLISLIDLNKKVLAGQDSKIAKLMWLEDGSIIFRSVATNPSKTISQSVNVKFYLPEELKKEQIISNDPLLKIEYDPIQKSLFAETNVDLKPLESSTFSIETEDIWSFKQEEIDLLKNQASDLTKALKGKTQYTQAQAINSDIATTLDKVILKQSQAITPENRIRAYRESSIEILGVEEKIENLKQLLFQDNSKTTNFNGQSLIIIGIIIMGLASLLFLYLYLRSAQRNNTNLKTNNNILLLGDSKKTKSAHIYKKNQHRSFHKLTAAIVIGLFTSGVVAIVGSIGYSYHLSKQTKNLTLKNSSSNTTSIKTATLIASSEQKVIGKSSPSLVSPEAITFSKDQQVYVYKKINGWTKIGLTENETADTWWVNEIYIK